METAYSWMPTAVRSKGVCRHHRHLAAGWLRDPAPIPGPDPLYRC